MLNNLGFRNKLLLTIIPIVVLGVLSIGLIGYWTSAKIVKGVQNEDMTLLTRQVREQLTAWMEESRREAGIISSASSIARACLTDDAADAQALLDACQARSPQYEALWLASPDGTILLDSIGGKAIGMEVRAMPQFTANIEASNQGRMQLSAPDRSPASGLPIALLTAPVEANGQVVGILGLSIQLDYFWKHFLSKIKIGENGYAYLINSNGVILAHPNSEYILDLDISEYAFGQEIIQQKSGSLIYQWNGLDKIAFFETDPATGWTVISAPVPNDFLKPLKDLRNELLLIAAVVVLLACAAIYLISSILSKSVQKVGAALELMAQGDLGLRLQTDRRDEIGRIYQSMDEATRRLDEKTLIAKQIAEGDISMNVEPGSAKDRLGYALKQMVQSLRGMLDAIQKASLQISSSADQVADASQSLSQGASEQAASVEQISSSITEIESQVKQTAANADKARQEAQEVQAWAEKGAGEMEALVEAMTRIDEAANRVSNIIKTIDDIAFQTNLLALNAAVEAARAGKHGKGFTVVAREVKNLAGQSARAAKETEALIQDAIQKVKGGTTAVDRTGKALSQIVTGVSKVSGLIDDISTAGKSQAEGVEEIGQGLSQIEQVTYQNTANAEQGASAADSLSSQSKDLMKLLDRFKLNSDAAGNGNGKKAAVKAPSVANESYAQVEPEDEPAVKSPAYKLLQLKTEGEA